ncbi:hypothetical protein LTR17_022036 [Elasticomyces elasticus]|nr:hypothetical protein LTR17_022036 [Elasticomyces elasticus]
MAPAINQTELDRLVAEYNLRIKGDGLHIRVGECKLHQVTDITDDEISFNRPAFVWTSTSGELASVVFSCDCSATNHQMKDVSLDFPNLAHNGQRALRTTKRVLGEAIFEARRQQQQLDIAGHPAPAQPTRMRPFATATDTPTPHTQQGAGASTSPADDEADDERTTCQICQDDYADAPRKAVTWTPCAHKFHEDCLEAWYAQARSCPKCRTAVDGTSGSEAAKIPVSMKWLNCENQGHENG